MFAKDNGDEKEVPGTIWVEVVAGKPPKKHVKIGWDGLPTGQIFIIKHAAVGPVPKPKPKKDRRVGLADWPGQEGVHCTFVPSGRNYGDIGDLIIENDCNEPVTVTVPPGLMLESSDPGVQDRARTRERERKEGKLPAGVIEIGDNPGTRTDAAKTCTRKKDPGRRMQDSEATGLDSEPRSFTEPEKARLTELLNGMPNFLYNMDMVFLRVETWAFDPNNPGGYQPGGGDRADR